MKRKIETHHYAARLNEDVLQCLVYDSDETDARLIGMHALIFYSRLGQLISMMIRFELDLNLNTSHDHSSKQLQSYFIKP
jgi:hypothetical protein